MILTGTIQGIDYSANPEKAIISLKMERGQAAYIEFHSKRAVMATHYKAGDHVNIDVYFSGKKSKTTGKEYNNLLGQKIKPVEAQNRS